MRLSVLLISILALYLISIGTQAYGSTQGTNQCDLSFNQSCLQSSQAESETSQTPLILPDLSPTREDLDNTEDDESAKTVDSDDNDDVTTSTSTSTDSGDNSNADNSDDEQEANDEDSNDSDGEYSDDGPSMIPFP